MICWSCLMPVTILCWIGYSPRRASTFDNDVIVVGGSNSTCKPSKYPTSFISKHYNDVIMSPMASLITSLAIVYSTVYSGADQRNHQSSASLAFVRGIHRWPVNSPYQGPVTRKMFPFYDVIMAEHGIIIISYQPPRVSLKYSGL